MPAATKRYLALDVGDRRTGLAATDWTGTICVPLDRLDHENPGEMLDLLAPIVAERQPDVIVVGVPLSMDGSHSPQAEKILAVVADLRKRYPDLEITTMDESHTTDRAHELLKSAGLKAAQRRRFADSIAALEILRRHVGLGS